MTNESTPASQPSPWFDTAMDTGIIPESARQPKQTSLATERVTTPAELIEIARNTVITEADAQSQMDRLAVFEQPFPAQDCCGDPGNCPRDYRNCPTGGVLPSPARSDIAPKAFAYVAEQVHNELSEVRAENAARSDMPDNRCQQVKALKDLSAKVARSDMLDAERKTLTRVIECAEILDKRPRPMCRDCADEDGKCPHDGLDCDMRKLFRDARAILAAKGTHTERALDALRSIRDAAAFDASLSGDVFYRKAENALAAIECRDAVEKSAQSAPSGDVREAFDAAFLSWNGFHTKAELDAEWAPGTLAGEMFRAGAALARRATAGTTAPVEHSPDCENKGCTGCIDPHELVRQLASTTVPTPKGGTYE